MESYFNNKPAVIPGGRITAGGLVKIMSSGIINPCKIVIRGSDSRPAILVRTSLQVEIGGSQARCIYHRTEAQVCTMYPTSITKVKHNGLAAVMVQALRAGIALGIDYIR